MGRIADDLAAGLAAYRADVDRACTGCARTVEERDLAGRLSALNHMMAVKAPSGGPPANV